MFSNILIIFYIKIDKIPNDTYFPYEIPDPVKSNTIYVKFC